jgi:DNA modification methylase
MDRIKLYEGDSYVVLKRLFEQGVRFASCVCDPPYGLTSIVKRFGSEKAKAAKFGRDGAFSRTSAAFMGQTWDANGVENDPEFWKLVLNVLEPGGFIVAFSSPRTYHKMATAIEAAGFITHPMIGWAYASGLPKGHHTKVKGWEGYRHGGQARKPALEPIYVGQKPYSTRTCRENILKHGVGAVDIAGIMQRGRYPANLITDGEALGEAGQFYETYPFEEGQVFYHKKADKYDRAGSDHATVKPIGLMRSLVKHVTPEGLTTLDPFAGSGSTGIAAAIEGRNAVLIEAEASYARAIRSRLTTLTPAGSAYLKALGVET